MDGLMKVYCAEPGSIIKEVIMKVYCADSQDIMNNPQILKKLPSFNILTSFYYIKDLSIYLPFVNNMFDVLAEIYGYKKARKVIFLGFLLNLLAVICYQISIMLPAPVYFTGSEAFATVLGNTSRVLLASFTAYIIGSLVNAYLMTYLKRKAEQYLFMRCIVSTLFGEGLDAILFISIAFYGTMPLIVLLTMIVAQALFKTVYEIIIYPVTRHVITYVRSLPE